MAQFNHRIDLTKSNFPLLSSEMGRTVLISNNRSTPTSEAPNPPEVLYMHNVMPTSRGLQSVGFKEIIAAPTGGDATTIMEGVFDLSFIFSVSAWKADKKVVLAYTEGVPSTSPRFIYSNVENTAIWVKETAVGQESLEPTVANVNGQSYALLFGNTPYYYDQTAGLTATAFIGSPFIDTIIGITEAFGYLIAWSGVDSITPTIDIAWSSLINPLDLTPSAITGAGNGKVEGAKGGILFCAPNSTGFLVYCVNNVVAAIYTGNKQFPFKFIPVEESKGLGKAPTNSDEDHFNVRGMVAYNTDSYGHFIYSGMAGLQTVNSKKAASILPEVTDFLSGRLVEDFDTALKTFSIAEVPTNKDMHKKLTYVASRYLIISYGVSSFTHAIIYDTLLDKVGKIKFTHVECFEYSGRQTDTAYREISKEAIAFIDNTGLVSVLSFNPVDTIRSGVLILGKYQYHRDRFLTLHRVVAENVDAADSFSCTDMISLDGRNVSSLVTGTETSGVGYRDYAFQSSAKNHSLAFIGSFILNSLELLFTLGGRR